MERPESGILKLALRRALVDTGTIRMRATTRTSRILLVIQLAVLAVTGILSGCNPFAPDLEEGDPFGDIFGDPTTVPGFFTNFRNAYELRDIALYEPLLDSAFVFSYRDYDASVDREWGFAQDLESTRRLFDQADVVRLQWNQVLSQDTLDAGAQVRIVRSFNLSISLRTGEAFAGGGNVNFLLVRSSGEAAWRLLRWRDESEF